MSVKLMAQVWELDLDRDHKIVLLAFADHADDDGRCYPSIARIAWKCGYSERSTQRKVGELVELGLLQRTDNENGGRGLTPRYVVDPDQGTPLTPFGEKGDRLSKGAKRAQKGDKPSTLDAEKGDRAVAPESPVTTESPEEPSGERARVRERVAAEKEAVQWMHPMVEVMLCDGRKLSLTATRRDKYRAMFREQLRKSSDPKIAFKLILRCVQLSDFHNQDPGYLMPESLFLNEERRSTWVERTAAMIVKAKDHTAAGDRFAAEYEAQRARRNGGA